jgi:hemin uptake protein HemP
VTEETPESGNSPPPAKFDTERLTYRTEDLMQGRKEIWIEHAGEQYRLRITAAGKLYLTK